MQTRDRIKFSPEVVLVATLVVLAASLPAPAQVHSANDELWTTGDFNGDGIRDLAIVARESGAIRLGRGQADGSLIWDHPYPSDLPAVTSMAAERFDPAARDSLALVSPTANRAVRWWLNAATPELVTLPMAGLGPALVAAGAAGNTTNPPQLAVISTLNSGPATDNLHLLRSRGGLFQAGAAEPFGAAASFLGRANLGAAVGTRNFILRKVAETLRLEVYDFSGTNRSVLASAPLAGKSPLARALPISVGAGFADLLVFEAGQTNILWLKLSFLGDAITLGAPFPMPVAAPIAEVFPISTGATWRIAVRETGDRRLAVYEFSLTGVPHLELQSTVDASGTDAFLGATTGPGDELLVLASDLGGTRIERSIRYALSGGAYVEVGRQSLPALTPWTLGANVFLLSAPPFTTSNALTLASLRVGDWTDSVLLGVPPGGGTVVAETFGGAATGLSDPLSQIIAVPAGVNGGLINAYRPNVSVLSWSPASPDPLPEVRPTPPAGVYSAGLIVQLSPSPVTPSEPGKIFYRANAGPWGEYSGGGSGPLSQTTSLDMYWRRTRDGARGPIQQAVYTIHSDESVPDCDHDGVPDFVEVLNGLDPCASGPDADHDGASDLAELLNGTNPAAATNRPPAGSALNGRLERVVYVALSPHSHGGTSNLPPQLLPSFPKDTNAPPLTRPTKLWLFDSFGQTAFGAAPVRLDANDGRFPFAETRVLPLPDLAFPAALFTASDASFSPTLLVGVSEDRFDLIRDDGGNVANRGRELLGFVAPPPNPPTEFTFIPGTNSLAAEASRWLAEAMAFYLTRESPTQAVRLDYLSTLEVVLVEHTVGQLLYQRESIATPRLTMTPFRTGEPLSLAGLDGGATWSVVPFNRDLLHALENRFSESQAAYSLTVIRDSIHALLTAVNSPTGPLRDVAAEFYRLAALPVRPSATIPPLPVDALRSFLHDGTNHQAYVTSTNWRLTDAQMDAALLAARNLTNQVPALVEGIWVVRLDGDLRRDRCVAWSIEGSGLPLTLVDGSGEPYRLQFGFDLAAGARVRVRGYVHTGPPAVCAGMAVRPTQFELLEVPAPVPGDSNGNGVSDDLERFHFGNLISDRNADRDHDGVPDLAEILLGTDPNDGTVECSKSKIVECGTPWSFDPPTVTGGCCSNLNFTLILSNVVLETPDQSVRAGVWLVGDCCSNSLVCTQLVTVVHSQPPMLACAGNKNVYFGEAWSFDPPVATAACCISNVVVNVLSTVTNGPSPTVIIRTWLASDCWGNSNACSQVITVISNSPPPEPLVAEDFNYPAGSLLVGQNGGIGWAEPWTSFYNNSGVTVEGGFLDPQIPGLLLSGGSLKSELGTLTADDARRRLNIPIATNDTLWFSVILQSPASAPGVTPNTDDLYFFFDLFDINSARHLKLGPSRSGSSDPMAWSMQVRTAEATLAALGSLIEPDRPTLLVAQMVKTGTSGYVFNLWINPAPDSAPPTTPNATLVASDLAVSTLAGVEYYHVTSFAPHPLAHKLGQIRIGTSYPTVVPASPFPTITRHPQSQAVVAGDPVTLTVDAAGSAPLSYQWFRNGQALAGFTIAELTFSHTSLADAGEYFCRVTNQFGLADSSNAVITVTSGSGAAARLFVEMGNGGLQLRVVGTPDRQYRLELSTDLTAWQPVATNSAPDGVILLDLPAVTLAARGFYRAVLLP